MSAVLSLFFLASASQLVPPTYFLSGDLPTGPGVHGHPDSLWNELPGSQGGHTQRPGCQELCVSVPHLMSPQGFTGSSHMVPVEM